MEHLARQNEVHIRRASSRYEGKQGLTLLNERDNEKVERVNPVRYLEST